MKSLIFFIALACFLISCDNSNSNSNSSKTKVQAGRFEVGESVLWVSGLENLESGIVQKAEGTKIILKLGGGAGDISIPDSQIYRKSEILPLDVSVLIGGDGKIIEDNSVVFFQNKVLAAKGKWGLGKIKYSNAVQYYSVCGNPVAILDEEGRMIAADKWREYQPTTIAAPRKETVDEFKKNNPDCFKGNESSK